MTKDEAQTKVDAILKRFVYTEAADREEARRLNRLKADFNASLVRSQVAGSEPVKIFLQEIRSGIQEINLVLTEKAELLIDERSCLMKLKLQFQWWDDFWSGAEKRVESLASEIDEEHRVKTAG